MIGANIAARRKALRFKQAEIAEKIGLTRASVANIEKGRQKLMLHQVYKLAVALEIDSITDLVPQRFSFEQASGPIKLEGSDVSDALKIQIEQYVRRKNGGQK